MTSKKRPSVGFGIADITPPLPFPLAGMASRSERLADRIRDPFHARALALSDKKTTAVVVSVDLLMTTPELREAVEQKLQKMNVPLDGMQLSATHSHSAPGGYWTMPASRLFLGRFRQSILDCLVDGISRAVKQAVDDLGPADLFFGDTRTQGLNYNRRHKDGPIDRTLGVLTVRRAKKKNIRVVFFGAHPVVVAFREYSTASADYPAEVIKKIEEKGDIGMFVVGPVGGVNVLFPEGPMDLEVHLALLSRLLYEQVEIAEQNQVAVKGADVAFAVEASPLNLVIPRLFPDSKAWADVVLYPLRLWIRNFGRKGLREGHKARVPVLRVGNLVFTGYPADMGAGLGLATRKRIEEAGLLCAVVASQTDDYVGYVHLPPEYQQFETRDKSAMWMNIYENGLAFGGRRVGQDLLAAFEKAFERVTP